MRAVRERFRPEFLNRLDEIVLFRRLARGDMAAIVDIQLGGCASCWRIARSAWSWTRRAREWLAEAGYDPIYGARPLKRVIQRSLQDKLAEPAAGGRAARRRDAAGDRRRGRAGGAADAGGGGAGGLTRGRAGGAHPALPARPRRRPA